MTGPPDASRAAVVIGGYGVFGARVCGLLARLIAGRADMAIIIAGRRGDRAGRAAAELARAHPTVVFRHAEIDVAAPHLAQRLRALSPCVVVDASGPFQDAPPRVARACLEIARHYVDLADSHVFVASVMALDGEARETMADRS